MQHEQILITFSGFYNIYCDVIVTVYSKKAKINAVENSNVVVYVYVRDCYNIVCFMPRTLQ